MQRGRGTAAAGRAAGLQRGMQRDLAAGETTGGEADGARGACPSRSRRAERAANSHIHVVLGGVPRDGLRGAAREGCCTNPVRVGRRVRSREPGRERTRGGPDTRTSGGHGPCPTELLASACHLSQVQASALPQRKHLGRKHAGQALRFGGSAARASVAKGGGGGEGWWRCRRRWRCRGVESDATRPSLLSRMGCRACSRGERARAWRASAVSAARAGMGSLGLFVNHPCGSEKSASAA